MRKICLTFTRYIFQFFSPSGIGCQRVAILRLYVSDEALLTKYGNCILAYRKYTCFSKLWVIVKDRKLPCRTDINNRLKSTSRWFWTVTHTVTQHVLRIGVLKLCRLKYLAVELQVIVESLQKYFGIYQSRFEQPEFLCQIEILRIFNFF